MVELFRFHLVVYLNYKRSADFGHPDFKYSSNIASHWITINHPMPHMSEITFSILSIHKLFAFPDNPFVYRPFLAAVVYAYLHKPLAFGGIRNEVSLVINLPDRLQSNYCPSVLAIGNWAQASAACLYAPHGLDSRARISA